MASAARKPDLRHRFVAMPPSLQSEAGLICGCGCGRCRACGLLEKAAQMMLEDAKA